MKRKLTYLLTTADLKEAITDYVNKINTVNHTVETIEGFAVHQSSNDIREYDGYIAYEEEAVK